MENLRMAEREEANEWSENSHKRLSFFGIGPARAGSVSSAFFFFSDHFYLCNNFSLPAAFCTHFVFI
jgi:hypothetical protein